MQLGMKVSDHRVGVRFTRMDKFVLSSLKDIVERFHSKNLSESSNALPACKAKNLSQGIIDSQIAVRHLCTRILLDGAGIREYWNAITVEECQECVFMSAG